MIIKIDAWRSKKPETVMHDIDFDPEAKWNCPCGMVLNQVWYENDNPKTKGEKPMTRLPLQRVKVLIPAIPAVPATLLEPEIPGVPERYEEVWMNHWPYCDVYKQRKADSLKKTV